MQVIRHFDAVSEIRRIIGDNGRAMLADLPAAVEAALAARGKGEG